MKGKLFIVGTPIGNLEDITLRALRILREASVIACEDTRRTRLLLRHYQIHTPMVSYHEHNEASRSSELAARMEAGQNVALVSDAGMPLFSDPGFHLVRAAIERGATIVPIPGPSALTAALVAAGLRLDRLRFAGFLPPKRAARLRALAAFKDGDETLVLFEAPHRIVETLEDVAFVLGNRDVVLARELTKVHEEFIRGRLADVLKEMETFNPKGEITLLIGPPVESASADAPSSSIQQRLQEIMAREGLTERDALKTLARSDHISKSELYRRLQTERGAMKERSAH